MKEFRRKQRQLFKLMKLIIIIGAVYIFVFIGIKPYIADFSNMLAVILQYVCDFFVIAIMAILFSYYSKYGKSDEFLTIIEHEISDAGYYLSTRKRQGIDDLSDEIFNDLKSNGFSMNKKLNINDFDFEARALKRKEYFYIVKLDEIDKNDIIAYLDSAIYDIRTQNVKRSGNGVVCFVCEKAEDNAVALSKMITTYGKKSQLKIAVAITETSTGRVYFLGNMPTKCQQLIANYVMNCEIPIKDKYIYDGQLPFQSELEKRMESFNIKDFKDGNFYAH